MRATAMRGEGERDDRQRVVGEGEDGNRERTKRRREGTGRRAERGDECLAYGLCGARYRETDSYGVYAIERRGFLGKENERRAGVTWRIASNKRKEIKKEKKRSSKNDDGNRDGEQRARGQGDQGREGDEGGAEGRRAAG